MQFWLIEGIMSCLAYNATDYFLTRKISGIKRNFICIAIAVMICCITHCITSCIPDFWLTS